jgi:hypothetical protein
MEQILARRPGVFELGARAWRSALAAFLGMLPLFAMGAAVFLALNYAFPILEEKLRIVRPASSSIFVLMVVPGAWVFGLEKLVLGLAAAPAALATMRHVLVGGDWRKAPGPMLRFWWWVAALLVLSLGALYLSGLAATPELQLVSIVLKGIAIVIPLLFLMIFPAVAAGEPVKSFAARMDKALERWDGNFWRTVIVLTLTAGPGILLQRVPAAIILRRPGADADAVQKFDATIIGSAVNSVLMVFLIVIVSAGVAWAFTSARLPRPAKQPLGTAPADVP